MKYFEKVKTAVNNFFSGTDIQIAGETEDEVLDALEGLPKASEVITDTVNEQIDAKTKGDAEEMDVLISQVGTLETEAEAQADKVKQLTEALEAQNQVIEHLEDRIESFETDMSEKVKDLTDKYANVTSKGVTDGGQKGKPALTKAETNFKNKKKALMAK